MNWTSMTNQFGVEELAVIESTSAEALVEPIQRSSPVVALRVLAEVMLNRDEEKLQVLLSHDAVNARWQDYLSDFGVDARDHQYAKQLRARLSG